MNSTARIPRLRLIETPKSVPQYEVRIRHHGLGDTEIEVWRMPSPATPQLTSPTQVGRVARGSLGTGRASCLQADAACRTPHLLAPPRAYPEAGRTPGAGIQHSRGTGA